MFIKILACAVALNTAVIRPVSLASPDTYFKDTKQELNQKEEIQAVSDIPAYSVSIKNTTNGTYYIFNDYISLFASSNSWSYSYNYSIANGLYNNVNISSGYYTKFYNFQIWNISNLDKLYLRINLTYYKNNVVVNNYAYLKKNYTSTSSNEISCYSLSNSGFYISSSCFSSFMLSVNTINIGELLTPDLFSSYYFTFEFSDDQDFNNIVGTVSTLSIYDYLINYNFEGANYSLIKSEDALEVVRNNFLNLSLNTNLNFVSVNPTEENLSITVSVPSGANSYLTLNKNYYLGLWTSKVDIMDGLIAKSVSTNYITSWDGKNFNAVFNYSGLSSNTDYYIYYCNSDGTCINNYNFYYSSYIGKLYKFDLTPINFTVPENTKTEIIDLPGLMLYIITLPFTFYSQGFNLKVFEGTAYAINFADLILCVLGLLIFISLVKIIVSIIKMII